MSAKMSVETDFVIESNLQENGLLEYLFTYFGIEQLQTLLKEGPHASMLKMWGVTIDEFKLNVLLAIDMVAVD